MFWETCAKHSFEIIVALLGSGLLGYLWSRWFDDGSNSIVDNYAYENQIHSLRDRIKQQDIDLQASASLKDTWVSEKQSMTQQINTLNAELDNAKESFAGFVSPNDLEEYQLKYEANLSAVNQHQDMLISERNGLLTFIKSLEAKIAQNNINQASLDSAEAKINELEHNLHLALAGKSNDEQYSLAEQAQSVEKEKHDAALLQAKEAEIVDIKSKLQQATSRLQEYENQIQKLKDALIEKENSVDQLIQSAQDADIKTKELDKHYNSLVAAKEEELKIKAEHVSSSSALNQAQLSQKLDELNELTGANQRLSNEITHLSAVLFAAKETEQAANSKLNEFQSRVHQLEQETLSARYEAEGLKSKISEIEKLRNSLLESDKKQKEWEGRWREASTEAEQYKLAHAQSIKEKDDYKAHLSTLEFNLVDTKRQFDEILHEHENVKGLQAKSITDKEDYFKLISQLEYELSTSKAQIHDLKEMHESTSSDHTQVIKERDDYKAKIDQLDSNLNILNNQLNEQRLNQESSVDLNNLAGQKLAAMETSILEKDLLIMTLSKELDESKYYGGEWEGRFKEANVKLSNISQELATANTRLTETHHKIDERTHAFSQKEKELAELKSTIQILTHEREKNQQSSLAANDLSGEWETKYNDINNKFSSELAKAQQTIAASKTQAGELETRNKEWSNKFNTIQLKLAETQKTVAIQDIENKKASEWQDKYSSEVKAWQKRIQDLESEKSNLESLFISRHSKEITNHKKQIVRLLDEVATLKAKASSLPASGKTEQKSKITSITSTQSSPTRSQKTKSTILPSIQSPQADKIAQETKATLFDLNAASTVFGKKVKSDDHKIIEGVGPKIEALLKKNKVTTWVQLSNTPIRDIQIILDKGGNKFSLADPTSWPAQARLASMGEWNELKKLQTHLTAGKAKKKSGKQSSSKTKNLTGNNPSSGSGAKPVVKVKVKEISKPIDLTKGRETLGFEIEMDDLKIIEGIGPKIQNLLRRANIKTWKALASAKTKTIQAILDKAGNRFSLADPKSWARQSKLAASGNWTRLKTLQDQLKRGK